MIIVGQRHQREHPCADSGAERGMPNQPRKTARGRAGRDDRRDGRARLLMFHLDDVRPLVLGRELLEVHRRRDPYRKAQQESTRPARRRTRPRRRRGRRARGSGMSALRKERRVEPLCSDEALIGEAVEQETYAAGPLEPGGRSSGPPPEFGRDRPLGELVVGSDAGICRRVVSPDDALDCRRRIRAG